MADNQYKPQTLSINFGDKRQGELPLKTPLVKRESNTYWEYYLFDDVSIFSYSEVYFYVTSSVRLVLIKWETKKKTSEKLDT